MPPSSSSGWTAALSAMIRPHFCTPGASSAKWLAPRAAAAFKSSHGAKIEQTFGCLQRYRRLLVDDEASLQTSRHMTLLASVFMIGMHLERMLTA
jgi:hypothetical protein